MRQLILASSSPRRQELLKSMGVTFQVAEPDVDERMDGLPEDVVKALASKKAQAAAQLRPGNIILSADTLVFAAGKSLGKPRDRADAKRMLCLLSGAWHEVYTGVCLLADDLSLIESAKTDVRFSALSPDEIDWYCDSGEPMGKAGAYAIQGLGGMFVEEIRGNYHNVVGLPTSLVRTMLRGIAYPIMGRE